MFYDRYQQVELWGKDLYAHLSDIYSGAARYCVLFVSANYARKVWTNHERSSAQERALHENREYILPVRFDDTAVPGLRTTIGYLDLRGIKAVELAQLGRRRLNPESARLICLRPRFRVFPSAFSAFSSSIQSL